MLAWWSSLPIFERVYWYFAVPFTVVFTIQLIFTFLGMGDGGGDVNSVDDLDIDSSDGGDFGGTFKLFTVRNFITFFTVFGWAGIAFSNGGLGVGLTAFLSMLLGLIVMLIIAGLFYFITRLTSSGNVNILNAKGLTGEVYIPIPAKSKGIGKIQITLQGSLREIEAMTKGSDLSTGTLVKVVDVINNSILVVEKIKE